MEDNTKSKHDLAEIMHNMSKSMGLRKTKIFGIELTLGVPKHEFLDFLADPKAFTGNNQNVSAADVITVAKAICPLARFYSETVCPMLGN